MDAGAREESPSSTWDRILALKILSDGKRRRLWVRGSLSVQQIQGLGTLIRTVFTLTFQAEGAG